MVINQRELYLDPKFSIMNNQFGDIIKLLQNYPSVDVNNLLGHAHNLRRKHLKTSLQLNIEGLNLQDKKRDSTIIRLFGHRKSPSNKT